MYCNSGAIGEMLWVVNGNIKNIELIRSRFHCTCAGEFGQQIYRDTLEQNKCNSITVVSE